MKILLLHGTIVNHDAIGNDIFAMARILGTNHPVFAFAEHYQADDLKFLSLPDVLEFIQNSENLLIYHHSIYWSLGEEILSRARCRIIFKYHNITPSSFYAPYCKQSTGSCQAGELQTQRLGEKFSESLWTCDSHYNSLDLERVQNKQIVPPFHQIEYWKNEKPDLALLERLKKSPNLKILFVGRMAPNKGHLKIVEAIEKYIQLYDLDIEVYFIGKSYTPRYSMEVVSQMYRKNLFGRIQIVGEVTKQQLMSYYQGCDVFLCMSEHEGFCVPVIEAQYFNLPIVALDIPAVRETMGAHQILVKDDPIAVACALRSLRTNKDLRQGLAEVGQTNFKSRFSHEKIQEQFLKVFAEVNT